MKFFFMISICISQIAFTQEADLPEQSGKCAQIKCKSKDTAQMLKCAGEKIECLNQHHNQQFSHWQSKGIDKIKKDSILKTLEQRIEIHKMRIELNQKYLNALEDHRKNILKLKEK